jgi:hypothetical protein
MRVGRGAAVERARRCVMAGCIWSHACLDLAPRTKSVSFRGKGILG